MRRLLARTALVVGLLGAAGVTTYAAGADATSPPAWPASASTTDLGREVFLRDCAWCHGQDGGGTGNAPSLESSGALATDFYLRTGRMPLDEPDDRVDRGPVAYPDDVVDALDAYVAALGDGPPINPVTAGTASAGRSLFLDNCAACHSASGTGMVMTGGTWAPELNPTAPQQVGEAVRLGPGPMPPFTEEQLSNKEVDDIVSYVQTLGAPQRHGGAGIDQYGPIVEGLLVWLVGLPLLVFVIRLLGKRSTP